MFRLKRNNLVKRLWKLRLSGHEATCKDEESLHILKSIAHSMLKKLSEDMLETLVKAIERKDTEPSGCVMVSADLLSQAKCAVLPHVLCCKLWRWTDLEMDQSLKQLSWCSDAGKLVVCCNPFHWSRLMSAETPPPPYDSCSERAVKQDETGGITSTETGLSPTTHRETGDSSASYNSSSWCSLAYWELRKRVGPLYSVHTASVHVFENLPQGDGMCLAQIQSSCDKEPVLRVREKIGAGLTLTREHDVVWLYNRSSYPLFVNSPTLEVPNSRTTVVKKVPPGYSLQIFNYALCEQLELAAAGDSRLPDGPYDRHTIRISFAKGWGPCYTRQFITACPCWIEVLLRTNR